MVRRGHALKIDARLDHNAAFSQILQQKLDIFLAARPAVEHVVWNCMLVLV